MKELIESCKKAIAENRCLGCQGLEDKNYRGNPNCKFSKEIYVQEKIDEIHNRLQIR